MGLKVEGYGALPAQLVEALKPRESELESVLNLPLDRIEIPTKKKDLAQLAVELDRQIGILKAHLEAATDPKVAGDIKHMLRLARDARLDVDSRLLSWAVGETDDRHGLVSSDEARAIFALFGSTFSQGEINHALPVLEAHLAKDDRTSNVNELVDATVAKADQVGRRTSSKSRKVFTSRVLPVFVGLAGTRALSALVALDPAVSLAVNLAAIQTGFQIGMRTGARAVKVEGFEFGVNRFEGEYDHDLVHLHERVHNLHQKLWKLDDAQGKDLVDDTVAVIRFLTARRRETWNTRDDVGDVERSAVARFEGLADQLAEVGVAGARGRVEGFGLKAKDLAKIPSLPDLRSKPIDEGRTADAFRTVVGEAAKSCLAVTNLPLKRLIALLEDRHLAAGSKLTEGEADALRNFVGDAPNVSEVFALGRLAAEGVVNLDTLWPTGRVLGHDGNEISQEDAKMLFETLGDRERGVTIQNLGRAVGLVAPFVAAGAAVLSGTLIGDPGLSSMMGILSIAGMLGSSLATHVAGFFLGRHVIAQGERIQLEQGLDIPTAIGNEYALLMPRLMDPETLLAGSVGEIKERLGREAEMLDVVISSVDQAQQNIAKALHELERAGPPKDPGEAAARRVLTTLLESFEQEKRTHYNVLSAVRDELGKIAGGAESIDDVRTGYAEIRSSLYDLMPITWGDIVLSQTSPEFPRGKNMFFKTKLDLLDTLSAWGGRGAMPEEVAEAAQAFVDAKDQLKKKDRPSKDAVDDLAARIVEAPESVDAGSVARVTRPELVDSVRRQRIETLSISEDRAKEIGQEVLNALWSQLYPIYGLVPAEMSDVMPELRNARATKIPSANPHEFPTYRVEGEVDRGGRLVVEIDAAGRVTHQIDKLMLDLGPDRLARMAEAAVRNHLEAKLGADPGTVRAGRGTRAADGSTTFPVSADAGNFSVRIDSRGLLDNASIREP